MIAFDTPAVLALAPVIGSAIWFVATWARHVRLSHAARWSPETERLARAGGRFGPSAVSIAAFLATVALAGPRWGVERLEAETRGLNLVMAVDISRSMLAEDAGGASRLARALREARRLTQDLDGDRLGLVAFAGASYILSPLSVDGSALTLYLDALDPDVASEGGTSLAPALEMGGELLTTESQAADRVLVVFTDGEAHDSLAPALAAARRLAELGVHVVFVTEGGRDPARIPQRDDQGVLQGYQVDGAGQVIETQRRDDILQQVADAAEGALVPAELPDQAGAVRDLLAAFQRAPLTATNTQDLLPLVWIPALIAATLLAAQTVTRRTAALVGLGAILLTGSVQAQRPAPGMRELVAGNVKEAARRLAARLSPESSDTSWYNAGTAMLAAGDYKSAVSALDHASRSLDPDLRYRALYNEGVAALQRAAGDSAKRDSFLGVASDHLRQALTLAPASQRAKWNLELAERRRTPPPSGGGQTPRQPPPGGQRPPDPSQGRPQPPSGMPNLSQSQAEQILNSVSREELDTRSRRLGKARGAISGVKDW